MAVCTTASQPASDALFIGIGYLIGERSGSRIPVIEGLPKPMSEDPLKALGAVAASTGAVAMFHAIGITPEAPTLNDAFGGRDPDDVVEFTMDDIRNALARLSTAREGAPLAAVSLGTPHFSIDEFWAFVPLLSGFQIAPGVEFYINTSRETLRAIDQAGLLPVIEKAGIRLVTDTCTYVTSILRDGGGAVMTNSGKWAHYAPANLGVDVAFGSTEDCLRSASSGRIERSGL